MGGNREYRSDVFCMLFKEKARALELYNALNGSHYDDPEQIETVELGNGGISLSMRTDASFILGAHLNIYEHQSTVCPNMPLRCLVYFTTIIYHCFWDTDIYGKTLVRIPSPHFVELYNGTEDAPAQCELKLSDAFEQREEEPEIELTCLVYNINKGKNPGLMEQSPSLRDYMYLVDLVRACHAQLDGKSLTDAIRAAMDRCIEENILKEFLQEHYAEVIKVMEWDFTFEHRLAMNREEGRKEGRKEGRIEGQKEANISSAERMLRGGNLKYQEIAEYSGLPIEQVEALAEELASERQVV